MSLHQLQLDEWDWPQQVMSALSPYRDTTSKPLSHFTRTQTVSIPTFHNHLTSLEDLKDIQVGADERLERTIEFIELTDIIEKPPLKLGTSLLVVQDYHTLEEYILSDKLEHTLAKQASQALAIIGTPGTGKSCFLFYLLLRLISEGENVMYRRLSNEIYWFHNNVVELVLATDITRTVRQARKHGKIFVLYDSVEPEFQLSDFDWCTVILATSPRKDRYHRWSKEVQATRCFVDVWTWPEFACLYYVNRRSQTMKNLWILYSRFGGIPRLFAQLARGKTDDAFLSALIEYEEEVKKDAAEIAQKDPSTRIKELLSQSTSHALIVSRPRSAETAPLEREKEAPGFSASIGTPFHCFATLHIASIVARAYKDILRTKAYDFYTKLNEQPYMRSAAGFMFEDMVLEVISYDQLSNIASESKIHNLEDPTKLYDVAMDDLSQATEVLEWKQMEQLHRSILGRKKNLLLRPQAKNLTSVDGVYLLNDQTPVLLQITLSSRHPIKGRGLESIWKILPEKIQKNGLKLVFITKEVGDYQKQSYTPQSSQTIWDKRVVQGVIRVSQEKLFNVWKGLKPQNSVATVTTH